MDDDDNDTAVDESAYDVGEVRRERQEEVITMPSTSSTVATSSEPAPSWAQKWKEEQKKPKKLTGTCAKFSKKGFGFIKRDDGQADLYVHQRDVKKEGFRSLLEGEKLEFDVGAMDDGRLHANTAA